MHLPNLLSGFDLTGIGIRAEKVAEPFYGATQLCPRLHTHLMHYLASMGFDSAFAYAQHVGNLFVR